MIEDDEMDISPKANLIKSYRAEALRYDWLIGEAIDNAFDANAKSIAVTVDDEKVTFVDDGDGITQDKIEPVFTLGYHKPVRTGGLGRFGIGIKVQAVNAGDILRVVSTSRDGRITAQVNWHNLLKNDAWRMPRPRVEPVLVGSPTGTTITITDLRKPPPIKLDKMMAEISERFFPALRDGKSITINGQRLEVMPEPQMTDIVERDFDFPELRLSARFKVGLLKERSSLCGINISWSHRTIEVRSRRGCRHYSGYQRIFGRLELYGNWRLARFKDEMTDQTEIDVLDDALFEVLEPLLEKVSSETMDARLDEIMRLINEGLPDAMAARPKHTKDREEKKDTPKKRQNKSGLVDAEKAEVGKAPARLKQPSSKLIITWDGRAEDDGIGRYFPGEGKQPHAVGLSKDDPTIEKLRNLSDLRLSADLLRFIALTLYEVSRPDPLLPLEGELGVRISRLLSLQDATRQAA